MIIVCGYGTVGKNAVTELKEKGARFVVVDRKEIDEDIPFVKGDAGTEETLKKAGIGEATALIACTDRDSTNALIVLMAKTLNPKIKALAVVKKDESISKLYKTGADYVVSDAVIGGQLLAKNTASPYVGGFIDRLTIAKNVEITEIPIPQNSPFAGKTLRETGIRKKTGVSVLAIRREDDIILSPRRDTEIKGGDRLVVIGETDRIREVFNMARGL